MTRAAPARTRRGPESPQATMPPRLPRRCGTQQAREIRRLEGQHLAFSARGFSPAASMGCAACFKDQFIGLVDHDAAEMLERENVVCGDRLPIFALLPRPSRRNGRSAVFTRAASSASSFGAEIRVIRSAEARGGARRCCGHGRGRVRRSGAARGNLAGLSRPLSSKAHFTRCCCARSSSRNLGHQVALFDPHAMLAGEHDRPP